MNLSVIVPVYNVERYLPRCLDSLLDQGFAPGEYEIICVDDGSTDRSPAILTRYAAKHPQIRVISQANKGVSEARNTGLRAARGEAVCFVDSDDTVVAGGLRKAYEFYDGSVDAVRYWCRFIVGGRGYAERPLDGTAYFRGTGHDFILRNGYCTFCYCYVIRRTFLLEHGITFRPIRMAEDLLFVSTLLLCNPRMACLSLPIYNYHINPYSATTTKTAAHSAACVEAFIRAFGEIEDMAAVAAPQAVRIKTLADLQGRITPVVSRMLTAGYGRAAHRAAVSRLRRLHILPTPVVGGGKIQIGQADDKRRGTELCAV